MKSVNCNFDASQKINRIFGTKISSKGDLLNLTFKTNHGLCSNSQNVLFPIKIHPRSIYLSTDSYSADITGLISKEIKIFEFEATVNITIHKERFFAGQKNAVLEYRFIPIPNSKLEDAFMWKITFSKNDNSKTQILFSVH